MGQFILVTTVISALLICVPSNVHSYERMGEATDTIVENLLLNRFGANDPLLIDEAISQADELIEKMAASDPTEQSVADVFFRQPMRMKALGAMADRVGVEILEIESKVSLGSRGRVITTGIRDFNLYQGTQTEKTTYFEKRHHERAQARAALRRAAGLGSTNKTEAAEYAEYAAAPLTVFRIMVIGANSNISELRQDTRVRAAIPHSLFTKGTLSIPQLLGAVKRALPASGDPLVKSVDYSYEITSSESASPNAVSFPPLPPGGTDQFTNDAPVDAGQQKPSSPSPPPSSFICGPNSGIPLEQNCPPDVTWLPDPDFGIGGDEAWGFLLRSFAPTSQFPSGRSVGVAVSEIEWSTDLSTLGVPTFFTNLAAFKTDALPICFPARSALGFGANAWCADFFAGPPGNNVVYIPDDPPGSAYEDEIRIPDPKCQRVERSGLSGDLDSGCFLATSFESDLPSPYLDTTATDPGAAFNASVGTTRPQDLTPGTKYSTTIFFESHRTGYGVGFIGAEAVHAGQASALFRPLLGGCWLPQFCAFALDIRRQSASNIIAIPLP